MSNRYLTKSRMKLGLECPKKLYYYGKKEYDSQNNDNPFLEGLAEGGYQVGELAKFHYQFKFLDYELARLKNCGELKKQGIMFHPKSPYYSVCADVVLVNPAGVVAPHNHQITPKPKPQPKPSDDASILKPISIGYP